MNKAFYYMTKVLYYKSNVWPKMYYQSIVNKDVLQKYYKIKQRCYDQSIVLQK